MKHIENIVINSPLVPPEDIFALSHEDWINGIVKSVSEVRRNKPGLVKELNDYDYLEIKWGKRKLFILVGK